MNDEIGKNIKEEKFGGFKNNNSNLNIHSDVIKIRKIKKPFENNINFNSNRNINDGKNNIKVKINDSKNKVNDNENINDINENKNNYDGEKNRKKMQKILEKLEKDETFTKIKQLQKDIKDLLKTNNNNISINKKINKNYKKENINDDNNTNIPEKINEETSEVKIKDVIPENKFTNYYEDNE